MDPEIFRLVILPLLIFLARLADVSIGTIRVIYISKGNKLIAPILGFFEILIWLAAVQQIFQNLNSISTYLAYAFGFSAGTFVGMVIEDKLCIGKVMIRIVTSKRATTMISNLRNANYRVTSVDGEGKEGKVKVVFMVAERESIPDVLEIVKKTNPSSFYSIEDVRQTKEPALSHVAYSKTPWNIFGSYRKSK